MTISDWINLAVVVVTLLGVGVAALAIWLQMRKLNAQLMLQHFADYTKRYQEIILHFPENINKDDFDIASHANHDNIMRYMRAYFDLCFEEWYLNKRKLIDEGIWTVWVGGISAALSKTAFRQAWRIIKEDSSFGPDFQMFVAIYIEK